MKETKAEIVLLETEDKSVSLLVEFRWWVNSVLRQYILLGCAVNRNRIKQPGEVIRIMKQICCTL